MRESEPLFSPKRNWFPTLTSEGLTQDVTETAAALAGGREVGGMGVLGFASNKDA
jgi:hypothetical protein